MITALTIWVIGWLYTMGYFVRAIHLSEDGDDRGIFVSMALLLFVWPYALGINRD